MKSGRDTHAFSRVPLFLALGVACLELYVFTFMHAATTLPGKALPEGWLAYVVVLGVHCVALPLYALVLHRWPQALLGAHTTRFCTALAACGLLPAVASCFLEALPAPLLVASLVALGVYASSYLVLFVVLVGKTGYRSCMGCCALAFLATGLLYLACTVSGLFGNPAVNLPLYVLATVCIGRHGAPTPNEAPSKTGRAVAPSLLIFAGFSVSLGIAMPAGSNFFDWAISA